jgi:SAM-dependent methyltransferase
VEIAEEEVSPESVKRPLPPTPPSRTSASIRVAKPKSDPPAPPVRASIPAPAPPPADVEPALSGEEGSDAAGPATNKRVPPPPPPRRSFPVPTEGGAPVDTKTPPEAAASVAEAAPEKEDKAAPRVKRPWFEELFNEDFSRALSRLSDEQIKREANFIEESLGVAEGGVLLDLGCGPGYHAVELAERGYAVVGYDLSLHQLALAADVAQEREQKLNLMQGDMREMAFDSVFDGIYCWNTTFGYFEEEKNVAVAENIFRALKPGGTFLVDVINRDFVTMQQPSSVWFEGDSAVCMDDMTVDFITSRLRVKRSLMLDDGRTKECPYSIRLYSLHELGKLFHDVGFRVAEASGQPSTPGVFMGQNAPRIIILAQRP